MARVTPSLQWRQAELQLAYDQMVIEQRQPRTSARHRSSVDIAIRKKLRQVLELHTLKMRRN